MAWKDGHGLEPQQMVPDTFPTLNESMELITSTQPHN
jgi:hypothetical protein